MRITEGTRLTIMSVFALDVADTRDHIMDRVRDLGGGQREDCAHVSSPPLPPRPPLFHPIFPRRDLKGFESLLTIMRTESVGGVLFFSSSIVFPFPPSPSSLVLSTGGRGSVRGWGICYWCVFFFSLSFCW